MHYSLSKPYDNYEIIINYNHEFLYDDDTWGCEVLKTRLFKDGDARLFIKKFKLENVRVIPLYDESWNFAENTYDFLDGSEKGEKMYDDLYDLFFKINNHLIKHDTVLIEEDQTESHKIQSQNLDDLF